MRFGNYQFICRFESEGLLPGYKGSTFRGVFGHALKKVVCALRLQECSACILNAQCLYAQVFETPDTQNSRTLPPPHPFVIEPPLSRQELYPPGSAFEFGLLLFGAVNEKIPYFIYAFDQVGKTGIGKRINGQAGTFHLIQVLYKDQVIYSDQDQTLRLPDRADELELSPVFGKTDRIALSFETPLRFKYENRFVNQLPFHVLVRAMLRRAAILLEAFGPGKPDLDYKGLVERANRVRIVESTLRWFDWKRYSNRQDQSMQMGGLVGRIAYEGDLTEYLPLIHFCKQVHLGKQTAFGLGKFEVEDEYEK
jgi:hypothetical protein